MPWIVLTSERAAVELGRQSVVVALRRVCLGPEAERYAHERSPHLFPRPADSARGRLLELRCYDTRPAVVSVHDAARDDPVGFFCWRGPEGAIRSARDDRVRELANLLAAEFDETFAVGGGPVRLKRTDKRLPAEAVEDPLGPLDPENAGKLLRCHHCELTVSADAMEYDPVDELWCCPTPGCDGAGIGFDLFPAGEGEE